IEELKEGKRYGLTEEQVTRIQQFVKLKYVESNQPPETLSFHGVQLAVAWGELVGGFALLFGLLPRLAALGLIIIQIGAIYLVTAAKGFSFGAGGGYEYNMVLVAMSLALVLTGGGQLSVDYLLAHGRKGTTKDKVLAPAA